MRITPATHAEADAWITVLRDHGHLHRAEPGPEGSWTVQRTQASTPRTLHHPVLAMDWIEEILREDQHHYTEPGQ
ncbi:hypothetical protein ACIRPT_38470 [Streptomyces sp. NPDC101227]|uniref:hypothetical protein n=1 Tax=Streptomyces sp. NPDC101227 TaxID=3366136 RepID=UPI0037FDEE97